jgi:fagellar hook-basal body proteins
MSISKSLYTGWTGLTTHQRSLDNTGNNLANSNTTGFKKNVHSFTNLFNQVISGSMPAENTRTTTIGINMGAGVRTGSINADFKTGNMDLTGNNLDVAINGNGFFMVNTPTGTALTRNGSFYLDHTESPNRRVLLSGDGYKVQGWMAQDGVVTPSTTTSEILLPAEGDMLAGRVTSKVTLDGVLPSNAEGDDFAGSITREMELKGNMVQNGTGTIRTTISVPVTTTENGTPTAKDAIQDVPVQITFTGPVANASDTTAYSWTMTTVDWPNPGDPAVQLYPPTGNSSVNASTVSFYNQADVSKGRGAGQPVSEEIKPGSTKASTTVTRPDGTVVEASFSISASFSLDVSHLTNVDDAPGGNELEAWYVDGHPEGTMSRSVTVYDEVTRFESVENEDGTTTMQAVRRVEARSNKLTFTKTGTDNNGSDWTWESSLDGAGGTLRFNTIGDLVDATGTEGSINYDFSSVQSINYAGSMTATAQDGYVDGFLEDITIDQYGRIFGHYSNDVNEPLAQLAMGNVPNPSGLNSSGGTLFYVSSASGEIMVGTAGDEEGSNSDLPAIGAGALLPQHLEGSNVELATEFTTLISTQRGYQSNTRIISTANEMLQTLVAMKR